MTETLFANRITSDDAKRDPDTRAIRQQSAAFLAALRVLVPNHSEPSL